MNQSNDVLFDEMPGNGGSLGIITLNRPQVLNSLNHNMILMMTAQLQRWASEDHIKAVIIQAVPGRAFCAGGDIRSAYDAMKNSDDSIKAFFYDEYQLNRLIFHFPKPYIALMDGITMGGGVGVSIHGSHRIGTDRLVFAMPETGIGFYPDVGGTYFLPRLPDALGFYLGLTGARINGDDCAELGLTHAKVDSASLAVLIDRINETELSLKPNETITEIIQSFSEPIERSAFAAQQEALSEAFNASTMEEILHKLDQSSVSMCQEAMNVMAKKSPTSLKVTLEAMLQGKKMSFDECMEQEYRLTYHFLHSHDFQEGIRAAIIDKDQSPNWNPNSLSAVTDEAVSSYFSPITQELT